MAPRMAPPIVRASSLSQALEAIALGCTSKKIQEASLELHLEAFQCAVGEYLAGDLLWGAAAHVGHHTVEALRLQVRLHSRYR